MNSKRCHSACSKALRRTGKAAFIVLGFASLPPLQWLHALPRARSPALVLLQTARCTEVPYMFAEGVPGVKVSYMVIMLDVHRHAAQQCDLCTQATTDHD